MPLHSHEAVLVWWPVVAKGVWYQGSAIVFQKPLFLTRPVTLCCCFPLVVVLFPLGDTDFEFGETPVVEVKNERNQRHTFALGCIPET